MKSFYEALAVRAGQTEAASEGSEDNRNTPEGGLEIPGAKDGSGGEAAGGASASEKPEVYTPYLALYEENRDFAGWLRIGGAGIDYPVMDTPEDPEYYLHRAFDGSRASGGTPFVGEGGTVDSDSFLIYGHNMKNGTMFGNLDYYRERTFYEENPVFTLTTVTEERTYEVFAAVSATTLSETAEGLHYYEYAGDLTKERFYALSGWLLENALYDTGIVPDFGDQIVILSTCSYHTKNGRFLVAARRKQGKN